jgi:hypothetical protein
MIDVVNISGFFSAHLFGSFVQGKKFDMLIYSYHLDYQKPNCFSRMLAEPQVLFILVG